MILNKRYKPRLQARTVYSLIGGFDLWRIDSQSVRKYFFCSISANAVCLCVCVYVRFVYMKVRYSKNLSLSLFYEPRS